jgi:signal transduction histidine kinase/ligand-binding sensor domain-containing protein/CheY-like chemotaxis protein/AraC-like DNA-binding protein
MRNAAFSKNIIPKSLLALGWILCAWAAFAQHSNIKFAPVAPDALSSSFVRCIAKDARGFMWFGTGNGLIRFDGTNIYRYEHVRGNKNVITDNRINAITLDGSGNLWIGTAQGLVIYDPERDHFINADSIAENSNHLNNLYISALCSDASGRIWIGTHGNGLNVYDPRKFSFTYLEERAPGKGPAAGNYITSLFFHNDTIWAGTKGGVRLFDARRTGKLPMPDVDNSVNTKEVTQVNRSGADYWIATLDGEIIRLRKEGGSYRLHKYFLNRKPGSEVGATVLTMVPDSAGNVWVAGENTPLTCVKSKTGEIVQYKAEEGKKGKLPTNAIRSVFIDNTGMLWVGTYNRGAYMVDNRAKKFESFDFSIAAVPVRTAARAKGIAEDSQGNIWIACDGSGVFKVDADTRELEFPQEINKKLDTRHVSALCFDRSGDLWIGTWGSGAYKINMRTYAAQHYPVEAKGFGDNKVFTIFEDSRNTIWLGSVGSGLFFFDTKSSRFVGLNEEMKADYIRRSAYVTTILEDAHGALWVGTLFGLYHLEYNDGKAFDVKLYLKNDQPGNIGSYDIQTTYEDEDKTIWIGTGDNGLTTFLPDGTFRHLQKRHGLASNTVKGILTDDHGNIWIAGSAGLSRYDATANTFRHYTKDDGLPSNEFLANACLRARDGKFYFGTDDGLVAFFPDSIADNPIKPVAYLGDFKLNNQSVRIGDDASPLQKHISLTSRLELPYHQRSFVLEFGAIQFAQSSGIRYCHKLEGFDNDWNCSSVNPSATYTNLDPGHYIFLVNASSSDGVVSAKPAQLEIIIHQAPWKTWWAMVLYLMAITALVLFLLKIRIERIKFKNQLEFERLAREKEHALTESKTQFFTDISHELRTPLSLIAMPLESLDTMETLPAAVKDRISTIRTSANKMMRLVNELLDFNKLENAQLKLRIQHGDLVKYINEIVVPFNEVALKRNIHFGVHAMVRSLEGWFDHDKVEKIIFNLLSNAFKFTPDSGQINVIINLKIDRSSGRDMRLMELAVVDNGMGIDADEMPFIFDKFYQARAASKVSNPGTGIGLSLTKGLVELHHGSIHVEQTREAETKFLILLPIEREVYPEEDICEISGQLIKAQVPPPGVDLSADAHTATVEDPDKPHILVVEDNSELRRYMAMELRSQFVVLEARDGLEGLAIAFEKTPDLIISDILMPHKSGIEFCTQLKSDLKTSHIPFILLTAKTTVDDQVKGVASGADVYITKPFSIRFLVAQVTQLIESRRKLYSRFSQDVYLTPAKVATNEIDQAFLQKAIDYIVEHMQDPQLGVDAIADLFNLSRMQVYRKIKALTGKSVVDFIRMARLKQALTLMETQKYTLSEIAYKTGFNSASYFTRSFKDHFGKAPSEYLEGKRMG